jgi:hypothetical protein
MNKVYGLVGFIALFSMFSAHAMDRKNRNKQDNREVLGKIDNVVNRQQYKRVARNLTKDFDKGEYEARQAFNSQFQAEQVAEENV